MLTSTLEELRDDAREMSDNVGNTAITDEWANRQINKGFMELVDLLVASDPERYYSTDTISTTSGTREYAVNDDVRSVIGVDLVLDTDERVPLEPLRTQDRIGPGALQTVRYPFPRYVLRGNGEGTRLHFDPDPGTNTYELIYVAQPARLSADADTIDGFAGWEDYVSTYAARMMKIKLEEDASELTIELEKIKARIRSVADERDAGSPPVIVNVRRRRSIPR